MIIDSTQHSDLGIEIAAKQYAISKIRALPTSLSHGKLARELAMGAVPMC